MHYQYIKKELAVYSKKDIGATLAGGEKVKIKMVGMTAFFKIWDEIHEKVGGGGALIT